MKKLTILAMLFLTCWASSPEAQVTRYHYLTPIDGSGTDADPYHSRCLGERLPGRGNIDLRPWGVARWLCASDVLPSDMTGVIELTSSANATLSGPRKAALSALIGKPITATRIDDIAYEILQSKLRANRDGKIKVWLGESAPLYQQTAWVPFRDYGYVADVWNAMQPAVAWATTLATETFTGSDGNLNGATFVHSWTEFNGTGWTVTNNQAVSTTASSEARNNSTLATDDMEVSVTVVSSAVTSGTGHVEVGPLSRKANNTTRSYYTCVVSEDQTGTHTSLDLNERDAGAATTLATNASSGWLDGDVVKIRSDASDAHSCYLNGVQSIAPVTDVTTTGNTYGGLRYTLSATTATATVDNFDAADYTAPSSGNGALRRRAL